MLKELQNLSQLITNGMKEKRKKRSLRSRTVSCVGTWWTALSFLQQTRGEEVGVEGGEGR